VYLALSTIKQAPVKTIAKIANIDRSELYRAIEGLESISLIEKIIATPVEYRSIKLETSISLLLNNKKQELTEIEEKTTEFLQRCKNQASEHISEDILLFSSTTEPERRRISEIFSRTEKTIDILSTADRFLTSKNRMRFGKAGNGVKTRLLIEKPNIAIKKNKEYNTEFRVTTEQVAAPMAIHDGKEAMVFISDTTDFNDASMFYTNNPRLLKIFCVYFDNLWVNAQEN
jgi:sugar-specific transcriptional regulator TrmB